MKQIVAQLVLYFLEYIKCTDTTEELVFEWVTTEWSKCSQTCGGSGFQVTLES